MASDIHVTVVDCKEACPKMPRHSMRVPRLMQKVPPFSEHLNALKMVFPMVPVTCVCLLRARTMNTTSSSVTSTCAFWSRLLALKLERHDNSECNSFALSIRQENSKSDGRRSASSSSWEESSCDSSAVASGECSNSLVWRGLLGLDILLVRLVVRMSLR